MFTLLFDLCGMENEIHDDLFFECPFNAMIWSGVLNIMQIRRAVVAWRGELVKAMQYTRRSCFTELYKLALAASI